MLNYVYHTCSVLFSLSIIYICAPGSSFFSWHPVLMSIGISTLIAQALVIFDSKFNLFPASNKNTKITWHWALQVSALLALYTGFLIIYINKNIMSKPHFTTLHGNIGLYTVLIFSGVSLGGAVLKYGIHVPGIKMYQLKWVHSLMGTVGFTCGCAVLMLGLSSDWALREMNRFLRCSLGTMAFIMAGIAWYLAKQNFLLRIFKR